VTTASERPSGGHCSRPASSTPRKDRPLVRSARDSSLVPVCPGVGDLNAAARRPDFDPSIPVPPRTPLPLRGFVPLRITAGIPICCREARLPKPPDLPRLPATRTSAAARGFGSATVSEAGCFAQTSWNRYNFPPSHPKSQSDSKILYFQIPEQASLPPAKAGPPQECVQRTEKKGPRQRTFLPGDTRECVLGQPRASSNCECRRGGL
jgi:hypothetical protein